MNGCVKLFITPCSIAEVSRTQGDSIRQRTRARGEWAARTNYRVRVVRSSHVSLSLSDSFNGAAIHSW
jgi:hypothetical protein